MSLRTWVQSAGAVTVAFPRSETAASKASPTAAPLGLGSTRVVAVALLPLLAARKAMVPPPPPAAVVNVQVTGASGLGLVSVMPLVSRAVYCVPAARSADGSSVAVRLGPS